MKKVLELTSAEAKDFFLKEESYCSIDLPPYFSFQNLLTALSQNNTIRNITLNDAKKLDDVNYKFLTNKDGKYAWRSLQLINPAIYINLVNKITEQSNWNIIVERFKKFQSNHKIKCCSIPVTSEDKQSDKANSIIHWLEQVEQQSLELALHFDCFLNTDITDCYGSIYTHSISWAIHGKPFAKANRNDTKLLGNNIDATIQSMQNAQTNGIPQGSALMNLLLK